MTDQTEVITETTLACIEKFVTSGTLRMKQKGQWMTNQLKKLKKNNLFKNWLENFSDKKHMSYCNQRNLANTISKTQV